VDDNDHAMTEDAETMHPDEATRLMGLARARTRRRHVLTALDLAESIGLPEEVIDALETDAAYWALVERMLSAPGDAHGWLDRAA
jgi:hypothetical protein